MEITVSAFDNRGTYTHICVYDYTQMPSQLHTIACSRLGANLYLKQFLAKLIMLKSQVKRMLPGYICFILIFQLYPTFLEQNLIFHDLATHNCVYVHTNVCKVTHMDV